MQMRISSNTELSQSRQTSKSTQLKEDSGSVLSDSRNASAAQRRAQDYANRSQASAQLKSIQAKMESKADVAQRAEEEEPLQGKFETAQRVEEEEPLQGKFDTAQRVEEEEPLQGKFDTAQRIEEEEPLQGKFETAQRKEQAKPNNTGLPNQLKSGIESMSGMSMDHVKVHYNSDKPAQLNAHAYAQGSAIHVAPGQEQHLPHEAWHVVQQAQGRVKPTMQMKMGVPVNDDAGLEAEADVMGAKAMNVGSVDQYVKVNESNVGRGTYAQSPVSQFTLNGKTPSAWATSKNQTEKKKLKLKGLADAAHLDDLVFDASELDQYYDEDLTDKAHSDIDVGETYTSFKRYVALLRDDPGGHGHDRHAGTGDQYIVDRVNQSPRRNFTASYLHIDEYLKWDSILKIGAEDIFEKYTDGADDVIADAMSVVDVANPNALTNEDENFTKYPGTIEVDFGVEKWKLIPSVYLPRNAFQAAVDGSRPVKVGASVIGNKNLSGRTVSKVGGNNTVLSDVADISKRPEAHTGGLAPVYTLSGSLDQTEASPEQSDLKWVTRF